MTDERDVRKRWNRPPRIVKNSRPRIKHNDNGTATLSGLTLVDATTLMKAALSGVQHQIRDRVLRWDADEVRARQAEVAGDTTKADGIRYNMALDKEYYRWLEYLVSSTLEQLQPPAAAMTLQERLAQLRARQHAERDV